MVPFLFSEKINRSGLFVSWVCLYSNFNFAVRKIITNYLLKILNNYEKEIYPF